MSWFKKATHLIKLPLDSKIYSKSVEQQIDYIAQNAASYYYAQRTSSHKMPSFYFRDPYSIVKDDGNEKEYEECSINVEIVGKFGKAMPLFGGFDPKNKNLVICPYNIPKYYKNKAKTFSDFTSILKILIKHELTHVVDPKIKPGNPFKGFEKSKELNEARERKTIPIKDYLYHYYTSPVEFDSICREIIESLRHMISEKPFLKEELKTWSINRVGKIPNFLMFAYPVINEWYQHDLQESKRIGKNTHRYLNTFKLRVYDEIFLNKSQNDKTIFNKNQKDNFNERN